MLRVEYLLVETSATALVLEALAPFPSMSDAKERSILRCFGAVFPLASPPSTMGNTIGGATSSRRGAALALATLSSSMAFAKGCPALCRFGAFLLLTAFAPSMALAERCAALC
mmetsp:Transcript_14075/g.30099  ORF Transcript_14075/g.30099 Transcript_14075/m.30099 type:complete len:113 (-) Transcript_14075:397-735(-)